MTEDKPCCDKVNHSTVRETERERKDPLPWLICNLRQKHQQLTEESRANDAREQKQ